MFKWYKFWKKSGPNQSLTEDYFRLDDETYPDGDGVLEECKDWAESIPGGHNTHYNCGIEEIEKPPDMWLWRKRKSLVEGIDEYREYLEEVKRLLDSPDISDLRMVGRIRCRECRVYGLYRRYKDTRESVTFDPDSTRISCGSDANNHSWELLDTYWKYIPDPDVEGQEHCSHADRECDLAPPTQEKCRDRHHCLFYPNPDSKASE